MTISMSPGEIADRYSICKLKTERANVNCEEELGLLSSALKDYDGIDIYTSQLYYINGEIWDLEADIRQGKEGKLGLEEVGRRALQIRNLNGARIAVKNKITSYYKEGFPEQKVNHASS